MYFKKDENRREKSQPEIEKNSAVAEAWLVEADKNTVLIINVDPGPVNCSLWIDSIWSSSLYLAFTFTGMDSNFFFFFLDC